jgi:hypothetical protein
MKTFIRVCLSSLPFGLCATEVSKVIPIAKEVFQAKDLIQPLTIQFEGNIVLSRYRRLVCSWEKGQITSRVRIYRYSAAQGGSVFWYEAYSAPGMKGIQVSTTPFFIDSYQNRDYSYFYNRGPLTNGLVIEASCVFQAWASNVKPVGNLPSQYFNPIGPWDGVLAYQATPMIRSGTPPHENGEQVTGPTQDEYRKVPFSPAGPTFFTLPGQNRHFGSMLQLLKYDPFLIFQPTTWTWVGGIEQRVTTVRDPGLTESPLPTRSAGTEVFE